MAVSVLTKYIYLWKKNIYFRGRIAKLLSVVNCVTIDINNFHTINIDMVYDYFFTLYLDFHQFKIKIFNVAIQKNKNNNK